MEILSSESSLAEGDLNVLNFSVPSVVELILSETEVNLVWQEMETFHFTSVFGIFEFEIVEDFTFGAGVTVVDEEPFICEFIVVEGLVSVKINVGIAVEIIGCKMNEIGVMHPN